MTIDLVDLVHVRSEMCQRGCLMPRRKKPETFTLIGTRMRKMKSRNRKDSVHEKVLEKESDYCELMDCEIRGVGN